MSATFKFNNVAELDKAIDQVILGANNLKSMIQGVSIGIVAHAATKGNYNVTRAKKLVDGIGAGFKQDSLVAFFAVVGINFDEEGNVSLDKKKLIPENMAKLRAKPWYEYKKENPYKGFKLEDALVSMLKKAYDAEAKLAAGKADASIVSLDQAKLRQIEAMLPADKRPKRPAIKAVTATAKSAQPKVEAKKVQTKKKQAA